MGRQKRPGSRNNPVFRSIRAQIGGDGRSGATKEISGRAERDEVSTELLGFLLSGLNEPRFE